MSNEQQYISPIIDAYLRRRQQDLNIQQEGVKNQLEQKRVENENKYREALIKEAQSRIENAASEHQATIKLAQQAHENASNISKAQLLEKVANAVRGAQPGKSDEAGQAMAEGIGGTFQPGQTVPQGGPILAGNQLPGYRGAQFTVPTDQPGQQSQPIPIGGFRTPEGVIQQKSAEAGGVTKAVGEAKEPFTAQDYARKHNGQMEQDQTKFNNQLIISGNNNVSRERIAQWHDQTQRSIDAQNNNRALTVAKMVQGGIMTPEDATKAAFLDHQIRIGQVKISDLPPADKKLVINFNVESGGSMAPTDKGYADKLKGLAEIQDYMNRVEDWSKRNSKDQPGNNIISREATSGGILANLGHTSAINTERDALKGEGGKLMKQFEGIQGSRGSMNLLTQAFDSLGLDKTANYKDNHNKNEEAKTKLHDFTQTLFPGQSQDEINEALHANGVTLGLDQGEKQKANPSTPSPVRINHTTPQGTNTPVPLINSAGHLYSAERSKINGRPTYVPGQSVQQAPPAQVNVPSQSPTAVPVVDQQVAQ